MADAIGLRRAWYQTAGAPHYDICKAKRDQALRLGALCVGRRAVATLVRRWRTAGDDVAILPMTLPETGRRARGRR